MDTLTALREQIREALVRCDGVYVDPKIPAKKRARATSSCRVPAGERVLGLVDCTVFGSAKHAIVFGERVYIRDGWTAGIGNGVLVVGYDELAALELAGSTVRFAASAVETSRRHLTKPALDALEAVKQIVVRARTLQAAPLAPEPPRQEPEAAPEPPRQEPVRDDIATHPDAIQLLAAIQATPDDEAPQLVLADLLLSAEDPRGELIVLDNREHAPGGMTDPDALERYLLLAAEYSFPRALPEEPPLLAFTRQSSNPIAYSVFHAGRRFDVRYRTYQLTLAVDGVNPPASWRLDLQASTWTTDETIVILRILSDAIRASSPLGPLRFPFIRNPLPLYDGGPLRCYRLPKDFTQPRGIAPDRYGLAARDYERWMTLWKRLARLRKATLHQQV